MKVKELGGSSWFVIGVLVVSHVFWLLLVAIELPIFNSELLTRNS